MYPRYLTVNRYCLWLSTKKTISVVLPINLAQTKHMYSDIMPGQLEKRAKARTLQDDAQVNAI